MCFSSFMSSKSIRQFSTMSAVEGGGAEAMMEACRMHVAKTGAAEGSDYRFQK